MFQTEPGHVRTPTHWRGQTISEDAPSTMCGAPITNNDATISAALSMRPATLAEYNICPDCVTKAKQFVKNRRR